MVKAKRIRYIIIHSLALGALLLSASKCESSPGTKCPPFSDPNPPPQCHPPY